MLRYELGPTQTLTSSTAETILWSQGTIPSGSQVKAVSFIFTGTAQDLDSLATLKFKRGGSDFISFANDLQISAYCDSLGKKTVASSAARFTVPMQNIYGWPIQNPFVAAPPNEALSIELVTDGTGQAGTITPVFHIDPTAPANAYPIMLTQELASGTPSNATFEVTTPGMLYGFILDTTNVSALRFNYRGQDIWNFSSVAQMLEVQELWQGTTVTTNRAVFLDKPVPVVAGETKLVVTGSGAVGQVIPLILATY